MVHLGERESLERERERGCVRESSLTIANAAGKAASVANHAFDHGHETVDDLTAFCETACASVCHRV